MTSTQTIHSETLDQPPAPIDAPMYSSAWSTPHRYVPPGTPGWRTCEGCGRGANARIHKAN